MSADITSPCCGAPLMVTLGERGRPYMTYEVVNAIECTGELCYNEWDAEGKAVRFYD